MTQTDHAISPSLEGPGDAEVSCRQTALQHEAAGMLQTRNCKQPVLQREAGQLPEGPRGYL